MSKAWMPLYIGDYLGDTSHLSQSQHGAYLLLMMHYWQKGMLQASIKHCYAVARAHAPEEQEAVSDILREFFKIDGELYRHTRIDKELSRITKVSEGNKEKARKAANARWNPPCNAPSIPQAMPHYAYSQSQSESHSKEEPLKTLSALADVALEIILRDESLFPVTNADIADWCKLFPRVDVVGTLAEIQKVCVRTPAKRKDKDGARSHVVGCLKMLNERKEAFERIWSRYPSKDGKKEAEKHFRATVHTDDDLRDIHQALDRYLAMLQNNPTRPPKNGSTWFNNWQDWTNWEEPINGKQETKRGLSDGDERAFLEAG
jgi:uncharacterized protein YdaU (DUF1376 family)